MSTKWSLVNLGELKGLDTQIIYHAAALAVSEGARGNTVLINWPESPLVCLGFHQIVSSEIDLDYCTAQKIPFYRRAVGGGTVLLNRDQIFYQIILHRNTPGITRKVDAFYKQFLAPTVKTYQDLGVNANYKPVNDILVEGRKISGNGAGTFEDANVLVGNFILDFPREMMAKCLNVPDEKFRDKVIKSLEAGVSSLKDELDQIPSREKIIELYVQNFEELIGVELVWEDGLDKRTYEIMDELKEEYQSEEWIFQVSKRSPELVKSVKISSELQVIQSLYKTPGGLIRLMMELERDTIKDILITGDFWMVPEQSVRILEKTLQGAKTDYHTLHELISAFYDQQNVQAPGTTPDDFVTTIMQGVKSAKGH